MCLKKYLITGAWGKLGSCIVALCIKNSIEYAAPKKNKMNILNITEIENVIKSSKFDAVLHLAAISDQRYAAKEKALSYQVNVIGTRNIANAARKYGVKLFYISTDYVFSGSEGNYMETDNAAPANWYGFSKYAGELEIMNVMEDFCIVRTSFRPSKWGFPTAYTNVYTIADYIDIIAEEIMLCLAYDLNGVIHIGTPTKSFYQLARIRNQNIVAEECNDETFPKRRDLNINKWLLEKRRRSKL